MILIYYTKFEVDSFPNSRDRSFAEEFATVYHTVYHTDVTTSDDQPLQGSESTHRLRRRYKIYASVVNMHAASRIIIF